MWVCKRLDMPWSDLTLGALQCLVARDAAAAAGRLEQQWESAGDGIATLSVRSGFDLLLRALALPPGSEVLFSAVTIKDMPGLAAEHGLTPVPIDLDPHGMAPSLDDLRRAITPRTRAIVVAHLFGGRANLDPLVRLARRRGLLVIEDCAQAHAGPGFVGHPRADVSMFSFGPIKVSTALGGGLLRVADRELLARMREIQTSYPVQRQTEYLGRILRYGLLKVLSSGLCYGVLLRLRRVFGNQQSGGGAALKNFSGPDLLTQIRRRPCAALLCVLDRRLRRFDAPGAAQRRRRGEMLLALLGDRVASPGAAARPHEFWVFPIASHDPPRTIKRLRRRGFDAVQGASMRSVPAPTSRPECTPTVAARTAEQLVYVPCYAEMPEEEIERLAGVLLEECPETWRPATLGRTAGGDLHTGDLHTGAESIGRASVSGSAG